MSLPQKIVVIGGGTGNATVVRAVTQPPFSGVDVTAIATIFDDGGGTGELRRVYSELPAVGDLRQCLAAMSNLSPDALRALARRFGGGGASDKFNVEGQTLGNLVLAGIIQTELEHGGTFSTALRIAGELFHAKGSVAPPSDNIRTLAFELPGGTRIVGEHKAEETPMPSFEGAMILFLEGRYGTRDDTDGTISPAVISREADVAIRAADLVIIAPGDLYTSIAPNLAVRGMREALQATKQVIMISNLMNRDRHTVGFTTYMYAEEMNRIIGAGSSVVRRILYSTTYPDRQTLRLQTGLGSQLVRPDVVALRRAGYDPRGFDMISRQEIEFSPHDALWATRSQIRHDPAKVAAAILNMYASTELADGSLRAT